jgi:hypothetical protein
VSFVVQLDDLDGHQVASTIPPVANVWQARLR